MPVTMALRLLVISHVTLSPYATLKLCEGQGLVEPLLDSQTTFES